MAWQELLVGNQTSDLALDLSRGSYLLQIDTDPVDVMQWGGRLADAIRALGVGASVRTMDFHQVEIEVGQGQRVVQLRSILNAVVDAFAPAGASSFKVRVQGDVGGSSATVGAGPAAALQTSATPIAALGGLGQNPTLLILAAAAVYLLVGRR